jgi:hypothetical protein
MGLSGEVILALSLTTGPIFVYWVTVSIVAMYRAVGASSMGEFFRQLVSSCRCGGGGTSSTAFDAGAAVRDQWATAAVKNEIYLGAKRAWILAHDDQRVAAAVDPVAVGLNISRYSGLRMTLLRWAPFVALAIEFLQLTSFSFGPAIPWYNPTVSLGYNLPVRLLNIASLDYFALYLGDSATYFVFLAVCLLNLALLLALPLAWRKAQRLGSFEHLGARGLAESTDHVMSMFESQTAPALRDAFRGAGFEDAEVEERVEEMRADTLAGIGRNQTSRSVLRQKIGIAWTLMINSALVTFALDITFLITLRTGLSMFACTYFYSGELAGLDPVLDRDPSRVCWRGGHFLWVAMAAVLLLLVYPFYLAVVLSSPFGRTRPTNKVISLPRAAVLGIMLKALIVGVTTLATTWVKTSLTLNFLVLLTLTFDSIVAQPALGFTRKPLNALRSASLGGALWAAGAGMWTAIRNRPNDSKPMLVYVLGLLPAMLFAFYISRWFGRDAGLIFDGPARTPAVLASRDERTRRIALLAMRQVMSMQAPVREAVIAEEGVLAAVVLAGGADSLDGTGKKTVFAWACGDGSLNAAAEAVSAATAAGSAKSRGAKEHGGQNGDAGEDGDDAVALSAKVTPAKLRLAAIGALPHMVPSEIFVESLRAGGRGTTRGAVVQREMADTALKTVNWAVEDCVPALVDLAHNSKDAKVSEAASTALKELSTRGPDLKQAVLDHARRAAGIVTAGPGDVELIDRGRDGYSSNDNSGGYSSVGSLGSQPRGSPRRGASRGRRREPNGKKPRGGKQPRRGGGSYSYNASDYSGGSPRGYSAEGGATEKSEGPFSWFW